MKILFFGSALVIFEAPKEVGDIGEDECCGGGVERLLVFHLDCFAAHFFYWKNSIFDVLRGIAG